MRSICAAWWRGAPLESGRLKAELQRFLILSKVGVQRLRGLLPKGTAPVFQSLGDGGSEAGARFNSLFLLRRHLQREFK
jgi:hypothetical protein